MSGEVNERAIEIIPEKFYYITLTGIPTDTDDSHFFCTDEVFRYYNYFLDFGPLNISQIHSFCTVVDLKLKSRKFQGKKLFYYSRKDPTYMINSVLLVCCYLITKRGCSVEDAFRPFQVLDLPFYHDASPYECNFHLSVVDCVHGLQIAIQNNLLDWDSFDKSAYEKYERVENGDINWIIEGKLLACSGPYNHSEVVDGIRTMEPEDYVPVFKDLNVGLVIRLNRPTYSADRFTKKGIRHYDLYFPDGGLPEFNQLLQFIHIVRSSSYAVAVHCKAGLGRTGTMICAYLMYEYGMTCEEAIGYCRLCRPGSVVGCQQHFLKRVEERLKACTNEDIEQSMSAKRNRLYSSNHISTYSNQGNRQNSNVGLSSFNSSSGLSERRQSINQVDQGSSLYNRKVAKPNHQTHEVSEEKKDPSPSINEQSLHLARVICCCLILSFILNTIPIFYLVSVCILVVSVFLYINRNRINTTSC